MEQASMPGERYAYSGMAHVSPHISAHIRSYHRNQPILYPLYMLTHFLHVTIPIPIPGNPGISGGKFDTLHYIRSAKLFPEFC